MQFLLSCAKTMDDKPVVASSLKSEPIFKAEAQSSALILQEYTVEQLMKLFKCSESIAIQNKKRFWNFFDEDELRQTILSYTGVAYKCMNVKDFSFSDFEYAQEHMWITSFLYGLLRPMDMIHSYRLEGNVKLHENMTMFEFWRSKLTDLLLNVVKNDDGLLVYIATEEMTHLFDWNRVRREIHLVEPTFLVDDGKRKKIVTVYAKMCRGAMARFIIKNRCKSVDQLKNFEFEGFEYKSNDIVGNVEKLYFVLG